MVQRNDYMGYNGDILDEKVRCMRCDEELIKAFKDDHVCDESRINQMQRNRSNELAFVEPPRQEFICNRCGLKLSSN